MPRLSFQREALSGPHMSGMVMENMRVRCGRIPRLRQAKPYPITPDAVMCSTKTAYPS